MLAEPIRKRHLGIALILAGILGIVGVLAFDVLRHHPLSGAYQGAALLGGVLLMLLGATLIPLGEQLA